MKSFTFNRRVYGNRCDFDQEATVSLDTLLSECNTEEEVRNYIEEEVSDAEPVLDQCSSYWCEEIIDDIDEKEIEEAIQEWKKAKGIL